MHYRNRAHGAHVVIPGVVGPVFGHGAVGIGGVPLGSYAQGTSFTAGNPITMNPFQHIPLSYQQPYYNGYPVPHSQTFGEFPPIPTLMNNSYPYY